MVCCLLFLAIFTFVLDITWCMYYRDYGLYFGGGSYSSVYVPPPLFVFPVVLMVCIPTFFFSSLLCFVCLFLNSHLPLVFLLPICVCFSTRGSKLLGGVHMHFIICIHMWILKYVYLTYFIIFDVIDQDC